MYWPILGLTLEVGTSRQLFSDSSCHAYLQVRAAPQLWVVNLIDAIFFNKKKNSILEKPNRIIMSSHLLQHTECIETERRRDAGSIRSIRTWRLSRTLMVKTTLTKLFRQGHIAETCDRACYRIPRLSLFSQGLISCMGWTVRKLASTSPHGVYKGEALLRKPVSARLA